MNWLVNKIINRYLPGLLAWADATQADFVIEDNYLSRWFLVKNIGRGIYGGRLRANTIKTKFMNIYLHCVHKSDDDRALHDHPWFNISIILKGTYREVYHDKHKIRKAGDIIFRFPNTAHRLEVVSGPVWSLFITGPKVREWGFRCSSGFVHWKDFHKR